MARKIEPTLQVILGLNKITCSIKNYAWHKKKVLSKYDEYISYYI